MPDVIRAQRPGFACDALKCPASTGNASSHVDSADTPPRFRRGASTRFASMFL